MERQVTKRISRILLLFTERTEIVNIKAFRPYIFRQDIEGVTSPPFDVITRDQEIALKKSNFNITHLTLPGKQGDPGQRLRQWIRDGVLVESDEESIVVVTQDFRGKGKDFCRIGLIAPVETSPPSDIILPHEMTFKWAVEERIRLMKSTGCQLEPIFVALNGISFERMLRSAINHLEPVRTFEEPSGVTNRFYVVKEPGSVNSIINSVSRDTAIVADGHHRLEAAREIFSSADENSKDFWRYSFAYVTSLQQESLMISGIHKLMGMEYMFSRYRNALESYFEITDGDASDGSKSIRIYDGAYHTLRPREAAFEALQENGKFRFDADPSLVNLLLFEKIMGMSIHDIAGKVSYTQSVPFAVEEVDTGRSGFAVLMPEWDKGVFLSMTERGRILPQKSTYFYPKIPSGIALYCNGRQ